MFKNILIGLGVLIVIGIVVIAIQPANFAVERSTEISAPAEVVFPHLDGAKALDVWSPWNKMDPKMTITHEGPDRGIGSSEKWEGHEMGTGKLTVTNVKQNEEVEIQLDFEKPMKATNRALFTLTPVGEGTRVAWRMEGTNNFVGKAASLVMNMDETVGGTFERGLADLKTLAEADAVQRAEQEATAQAAEQMAPAMTFKETESEIEESKRDPEAPATPPADE